MIYFSFLLFTGNAIVTFNLREGCDSTVQELLRQQGASRAGHHAASCKAFPFLWCIVLIGTLLIYLVSTDLQC